MHRRLAWFGAWLSVGATACGGRTTDPDSVPPYSGLVSATMTEFDQTRAGSLTAGFELRVPPSTASGGASTGASTGTVCVGNCCLTRLPGLILPDPGDPPPPAAGDITIARSGTTLATLTGPVYSEVASTDWSDGDTLDVWAAGGVVAPFSGTLTAPRLPAPSVPAIGAAAVLISQNADFGISWTPEGSDGETMLLEIESAPANDVDGVVCRETDLGGLIVVDASLLAALAPGTATIRLERTITTIVQSSNAAISLEGTTEMAGTATIGN
jgi:hypothetical protein